MDLSDIGMQKHRSAVSAAVVHSVRACDEDRRRAYSAATFGQFNNGEIFTLAGIHMGKVDPGDTMICIVGLTIKKSPI